jgi:hypothetical protein
MLPLTVPLSTEIASASAATRFPPIAREDGPPVHSQVVSKMKLAPAFTRTLPPLSDVIRFPALGRHRDNCQVGCVGSAANEEVGNGNSSRIPAASVER